MASSRALSERAARRAAAVAPLTPITEFRAAIVAERRRRTGDVDARNLERCKKWLSGEAASRLNQPALWFAENTFANTMRFNTRKLLDELEGCGTFGSGLEVMLANAARELGYPLTLSFARCWTRWTSRDPT